VVRSNICLTKEKGVKEGLLRFYDDFDETANAVCDKIYSVVYKYNLKACNISCFGADNSSVNYISCISILHLNIQTLCKETVTVMLYTT
jgi:hypothetical protein